MNVYEIIFEYVGIVTLVCLGLAAFAWTWGSIIDMIDMLRHYKAGQAWENRCRELEKEKDAMVERCRALEEENLILKTEK